MKTLIAIGDLHGHFPALEALLGALVRRGGVFAGSGRDELLPGAMLVFTGDYIDRGTRALEVISWIRRLVEQNPGQVVALLGNHELLALADLDEARRLAGDDPEAGLARYGDTLHGMNGGSAFVREFGRDDDAPALAAYVERMSSTGDVGRWMRSLLPCFGTETAGRRFLFTHGDIPSSLRSASALALRRDELLARLQMGSAGLGGAPAKYGHPAFAGRDSFFWSRSFEGLRYASDNAIEGICASIGADFVVTGHTMHRGRIARYGGRIFDIDVGMTPAYGENMPQALLVTGEGISAFRADGGTEAFVRFSNSGESRAA